MNYTLDNVASFQGAYAGGTTYSQGDIVTYSGSSYVSLINGNTGNEPDTSPSDWVLLAAQGPAGPGAAYAHNAGGSTISLSLNAGAYILSYQGAYTAGDGESAPVLTVSGYDSEQVAISAAAGWNNRTINAVVGVYTLADAGSLTVSFTYSDQITYSLLTAVKVG